MEDSKLKYYYALFIPVFFVGAVFMFKDYVQTRSNLYSKFPLVEERHEIKCKIGSSDQDKSSCLIMDKEGNTFRITARGKDKIYFNDYAESGDSIYKNSESDVVILVKSNGKKLNFILR
ncbi:MAG: hypothetical protein N4A71_13055 [Carboxylicivirga sp.]|jgi:hypothetical protein|nr:hypothetical protein [Carboxylicivirga sp.]